MQQEIWKDIAEFEGVYQISSLGRVKSLPRLVKTYFGFRTVRERILINTVINTGYEMVYLSKPEKSVKRYPLHRLIAEYFIPNPLNLKCVNHKNAIKTDNSIENLEWCTHSENTRHAHKLGLINLSADGREKRVKAISKNNYRGKRVRNTETGKEYGSATYACNELGYNRGQLYNFLRGKIKAYSFPIEFI